MERRQSRAVVSALAVVAVALATVAGVLTLSTSAATAATHPRVHHGSSSAGTTGAATSKAPTTSQVQVCDVAGDTGQNGHSFPILEANWNGWFYRSYSLTAGAPPGGCGPKYTFAPGTFLYVEQASSPGVPVPNVTATFSISNGTINGTMSSVDLVGFTTGTGLTTLTITDKTPPPPGKGTLELCKSQADGYVTGYFNFSLSGPGNFSGSQSVLAGQCNDVAVPSGNITVTEGQSFPYAMTSASTIPSTALVSSDNNKQTAVVSVVPNGMTTLFVTNATLTGYAKVCKTLYRSQDNVLAGQQFTFGVTATFNGTPVNGVPSTVSVTAGPYGTTACTFLMKRNGNPIALPLGTIVTATEVVPPNAPFRPVSTSISPSNLDAGSTATQAVFYVGNFAGSGTGNLGAGSVTQATFTNEALGYVEVCKTSSTIQSGTPFNFTIGGVGSIPAVPVGQCSLGYQLPVGTTTISESPVAHVSTTVTQSKGGSSTGTTATVTVPYNDENIVYFDNEINTGQLKVCKNQTSSDAGLQNQSFTLSYSYTANGTVHSGSAPLKPGNCALPVTVPVLNSNLTPIQISITEQTTTIPNIGVFAVDVVGPDSVVSTPSPLPWLVSTPGGSAATAVVKSTEGVTNVTFVNGIDITSPG